MIPAVIIPTMNEAATIGPLVRYFVTLGCPVVVSDCSNDDTARIAKDEGATVVFPEGKLGSAYLAAWSEVEDDRPVVHADAGDSHDIDDVHHIVDLADEGGWDVVVGSRFVSGGKHRAAWSHRVMSRTAANISNVLSPYMQTDWTSGLRAYSPAAQRAIQAHDFATDGHAWQIEALHVCLRAGLRVTEVPIDYQPSDSQRGLGRSLEAMKAWRVMVGH